MNKIINVLVIILMLFFVFFCPPVFCSTADSTTYYSIKHRWTIKTSIAAYKCWDLDIPNIFFGDFEDLNNVKRTNFRIEANYGFNKYFEIGLFAGFQKYVYCEPIGEPDIDNDTLTVYNMIIKNNLAPVFGFNINFNILPIFVTEKKCRWDLYLTARYGCCLLPHIEFFYLEDVDKHYRQEYGIGTGIAYYFGNRIGFYAEFLLGNFSYFPRFVDSNNSFRIGIACKL